MKPLRQTAATGLLLAAMAAGTGLAACDKNNYTEELQQLGQRVEILEAMVLEANTDLEALNELVLAVRNNGYVTDIKKNADGSFTVTFNTGKSYTLRSGNNGRDGRDGKEANLDLSVMLDPNTGVWYWTLNGQWLINSDGERVQAGATDGKDGRNGRTAVATVPQVRINPQTRTWEISTDGGQTWTDTGFVADGKNGKDGSDGKNGKDDLFIDVIVSDDNKSITFVLRDGRSFTIPINE